MCFVLQFVWVIDAWNKDKLSRFDAAFIIQYAPLLDWLFFLQDFDKLCIKITIKKYGGNIKIKDLL